MIIKNNFKLEQIEYNKMVRLTSLSRLLNVIASENLKKMKPWSERYHFRGRTRGTNGYNLQLINNVRKLLRFISGNKTVSMLKGKKIN